MDVSDIFYFFLLGEGKRDSGAPGVDFVLKIPGGGALQDERGRGAGSVCSELGNLGGGGEVYIFFFGAEMSTKKSMLMNQFQQCIALTSPRKHVPAEVIMLCSTFTQPHSPQNRWCYSYGRKSWPNHFRDALQEGCLNFQNLLCL